MKSVVTSYNKLYTIGHSDHSLENFLSLLRQYSINAIVDVRSSPYSAIHSQFNREVLSEILRRNEVAYIFMGHELGARRSERDCYVNSQARYDRIAQLPAFKEGISRIRSGVTTHRIAMMCAEKDPITCHRMVLICRELRGDDIDILHIRESGSIEAQSCAESRLLDEVGLPQADLFRPREMLIDEAYRLQANRIAYTEAPLEGRGVA